MSMDAIKVCQTVTESTFNYESETRFTEKTSRPGFVEAAERDAGIVLTSAVVFGVFTFRNARLKSQCVQPSGAMTDFFETHRLQCAEQSRTGIGGFNDVEVL